MRANKKVGYPIVKLITRVCGVNPLSYAYDNLGYGNSNFEENGEEVVIELLRNFKSNPVVFDVGANKGSYSKKLLEKMNDASIYAFEPHPEAFEKLKCLDKIKAFNKALSSSNERRKLFIPSEKRLSTHSSLHEGSLFKKDSYTSQESETMRLDGFCSSHNMDSIDFLKIDTEGHEKNVIQGAKDMIGSIALIQFEMNYHWIFSRTFLKDIFDELPQFDFYRISKKGLFPMGKYDPKYEVFVMHNILAINRNFQEQINVKRFTNNTD